MSNTDIALCPPPTMPEFAFIGRSNVGKSSLINMLTGMRKLAKTSSTPGKTQHINHFIINEQWFLVDLPGYGYAKVPKHLKEKFRRYIEEYILQRENLYCLFVLIDSRLEPQRIDIEFITWLGENEVPFVLVFTKCDKLKGSRLTENIETYKQELLKYWETLPDIFVSSAETGHGRQEILDFIESLTR